MKKFISSVLIVTTILLAGVTTATQSVGAQTHQVAQKHEQPKQLQTSKDDKVILGVCGGIAEYFGVDSTLVRIIFAVGLLFGGASLLIYVVAWLLMP